MAQLLIRDLDEKTVNQLKTRAKHNGRSLQKEAKLILVQAAGFDFAQTREIAKQWHKQLTKRNLPKSTPLLRRDRNR